MPYTFPSFSPSSSSPSSSSSSSSMSSSSSSSMMSSVPDSTETHLYHHLVASKRQHDDKHTTMNRVKTLSSSMLFEANLSDDDDDDESNSPKTIDALDIELSRSDSPSMCVHESASHVSPPPTPQSIKKKKSLMASSLSSSSTISDDNLSNTVMYSTPRIELPRPSSCDQLDSSVLPNALSIFPSSSSTSSPSSPSTSSPLSSHSRVCLFLDYDGTLTPIVNNPSQAIITESMRELVSKLGSKYSNSLSIVTGRKYETIFDFMRLSHIYYAGSHGFDIRKPNGDVLLQVADKYVNDLKQFYNRIKTRLSDIKGSLVEDNQFSISVHYRNVLNEEDKKRVEGIVDEEILPFSNKFKKTYGKMVYEIRPKFDWHKGHAVSWLLQYQFAQRNNHHHHHHHHHQNSNDTPSHSSKNCDSEVESSRDESCSSLVPIYIGDDITDEDAFRVMQKYKSAISIFVKPLNAPDRPTAAKYTLSSVSQVQEFLQHLLQL